MLNLNCNRKTKPTAISILILILLAQVSPAAPDPGALERLADYQITTLAVITTLTGEELAGFGMGYVLPMDVLGEERSSRIITAATKTIIPSSYFTDLPPGSRLLLQMFPNFSVTFLATPLGESGKTIPLWEANVALSSLCDYYIAAYPGDWRPQTTIMSPRDIWLAAATPETFSRKLDYKPPVLRSVKDPPKLDEILSNAPKDSQAKVEWLRNKAFGLVTPIGEMWLARDPSLPFTYASFAEGKSINLDSASPQQKEWLQKLYTNRHSMVEASEQPPWEDLGKVIIKLKVDYQPTISAVQLVTDEKDISLRLGRPDIFSPREKMEWNVSGKAPLRFAENQSPPVYGNVPWKSVGWLLTK